MFPKEKVTSRSGRRANSLLDELLVDLSKTVVSDKLIKMLVLLVGISAFGPNPQNLFLLGGSSSGKSYNAVAATRYFPKGSVWKIGKLSPSALYNSKGQLEDENNRPIGIRDGEDGKRQYYYEDLPGETIPKDEIRSILAKSHKRIDLSGMILLFLEAPRKDTFNMLKPLLSHDSPETEYHIATQTKRGEYVTRKIILSKWPACIFCSTGAYLDNSEELVSRSITASPEESIEKIIQANRLRAEISAYGETENSDLPILQHKIQSLIDDLRGIDSMLIPFSPQLVEVLPHNENKDMRFFRHFDELIKSAALFEVQNRPSIEISKKHVRGMKPDRRYVICNMSDFDLFYQIYSEYRDTISSGLSKKLLDCYRLVCELGSSTAEQIAIATQNRPGMLPRRASQLSAYELTKLVNDEYVQKEKDKETKRNVFFVTGIDDLNRPKSTELSKSSVPSIPFSERDAGNWLDRLLNKNGIMPPDLDRAIEEKRVVLKLGLHSTPIHRIEFLFELTSRHRANPIEHNGQDRMEISKSSAELGLLSPKEHENTDSQLPTIQSPTKNQEIDRHLDVNDGSLDLFCPKCKQTGHFIKNVGWQRHLDAFHQGENL